MMLHLHPLDQPLDVVEAAVGYLAALVVGVAAVMIDRRKHRKEVQ